MDSIAYLGTCFNIKLIYVEEFALTLKFELEHINQQFKLITHFE